MAGSGHLNDAGYFGEIRTTPQVPVCDISWLNGCEKLIRESEGC